MISSKDRTVPNPDKFKAEHDQVDAFLHDLTLLSRKHGMAFAGYSSLFVMEIDDYDSDYHADADCMVEFG